MNFFFGINILDFKSELQIPIFKNNGKKNTEIDLFQAEIENNSWKIEKVNEIKNDKFFFKINSNIADSHKIFFLANDDNFKLFDKKKLINFNNYTDTIPAFRANLKLLIKNGGFSSYQSEYPFSMVNKKGSILTQVNTLANIDAEKNFIFLKNIYEFPINKTFYAYFVNIKHKSIEEKVELKTNYTNLIELKNTLIRPEIFFYTDHYLGIPMFVSVKNKHISFEHTHPPHSYFLSDNKFKKVTELKKEINEIVN